MKSLAAAGLFISITLSGFGALPSKPDFAYPKTVMADAQKELASALKAGNDVKAIRAMMNYTLAEGAVNSDATDSMVSFMVTNQAKLKTQVGKAIAALLSGQIEQGDSTTLAAIINYTPQLREAKTHDWAEVISADEKFFPSLYDFAVTLTDNDSVRAAAMEYNVNRPYPLVYTALTGTYFDYDELLELRKRFEGEDVEAYVLSELAERAYSIDQRREVYGLCKLSRSHLTDILEQAEAYLTRPEVEISGAAVVGKDKTYKVKISAVCVPEVSIAINMTKPQKSTIATCKIATPGSGVYQVDTIVELQFKDYGEYTLIPKFAGMKAASRPNSITVNVSDIMIAQQVYGKSTNRLAFNGENGAKLTDVIFSLNNNRLTAARGNDRYTPSIYNETGYEPNSNLTYSANVITDRSIYHPGDTLRFAATAMQARAGQRSIAKGKEITVVLRNANHLAIDTLQCVSDEFGRISGSFALPKEGLTGNYTLVLANMASQRVMVTDYKAPTFEVEITASRLSDNEVELHGTAMGYNGFPIADAQVALSVDQLPLWVWFRNFRNSGMETLANDTVTTAADGTFTARLHVAAKCNLSASAIVTSAIGESHEAACFLPLHKYSISANVPEYVIAGQGPEFTVTDAQGQPANVACHLTLTAPDSTMVIPNADWSNVPSGQYSLRAVAEDADTLKQSPVYVYRTTDRMPPMQTSLFLPRTSVKSGEQLLVGTSYADSHILYTLWTPDSILEQRELSPAQGNFMIRPVLPQGVNSARITLLTLRDYVFTEQQVSVTRADIANRLDIKIESMRNRVTPGDVETWTIRIADNLGQAASTAVMLDVYCKALDALQPMQWGFHAINTYYGRNLSFNRTWRTTDIARCALGAKMPTQVSAYAPHFITYGQEWPGHYQIFYAESARMYAADAAPTARMAKMAMNDLCEDAVTTEESADAGGTADTDSNDDSYRLPEVPVALWEPVLTTSADGTADIRFTVPNANTTWAVKALAYNQDLLSGVFGADIIASKPVMVQPQLPRFLRTGDRIELKASVMNNTDSTAIVHSTFETLAPSGNEVIAVSETTDTIAAKSSVVISLTIIAPANASMLGVRARATSGKFTDGEQTLLPILPADMTIRTGTPIFLPADSTHTMIEVQHNGVLIFTANAVWECVSALPGLQVSGSQSAFSATSAIFSAATARGLMRQYPEIGMALHRWEQQGDSTLVSKLERNDDLKIALLSATPWMLAAQSQDEQRAALLLLFNRKQTDKCINNAMATLARLVRKGGLAWTENATEPSPWVTLRVLSTLAQLKRMGYLPASAPLEKIIREAVTYLDDVVGREYAANKTEASMQYVLMRNAFSDIRQNLPARRAVTKTVQNLVGHWRDLSPQDIAQAAIILNGNGYSSTAKELIESLRQYEVWKYRAISPYYLEAFQAVEPSAPEVNEIRSAYIARKHSMDWGSGLDATDLISAILTSGTNWLTPAANELSVSIDGQQINPNAETILGEFRLNLPQGGKVEIAKGNFPAWGGIYACGVNSITSIQPFASEALEITRTISGEMKVGAKVTVTLTLKAAQDIDYVLVRQPRCAAFEPVDQLPSTLWLGRLSAYREPCATETNWFFTRLTKGTTTITETFYVTAAGDFILAPVEAQSQYSPEYQAHTSGLQLQTSAQ